MATTRQTGSFVAKNSKGATVRVNIFTRYKDVETHAGREECAISQFLRLDDGTHVSPSGEKGHYRTPFGEVLIGDGPATA